MISEDITPVVFLPSGAHGLAGRLGFAPAPGRWGLDPSLQGDRWLDAELSALRASGTNVLVTLLEEAEMARVGLPGLLDSARRAGLESLWYPIPDGGAPSDMPAALRLVGEIVGRLAAGREVVVHCLGGIGRSGTIAACCLVAAGTEAGRALDLVREARLGAATGPGQGEFVGAFARAWAARSEERPAHSRTR